MKLRFQFAAPLALIALSLIPPPVLSRAFSQAGAAATPAFDVASIKRSDPGNTRDNGGIRNSFAPGGRFSAKNVGLKDLISIAYRLPYWRIEGGPSWIDPDMMVTVDRFNVEAKSEKETDTDRLRVMLQTLLRDRFKLAVHQAMRPDQKIYHLVIAKSGVKIPEVKVDRYTGDIGQSGGGRLSVEQMSMPDLARWLGGQVETTVIDKTNLKGIYKFDLVYTPENFRIGGRTAVEQAKVRGEAAIDPNGPSLFTAIQEQLGLRLEATKGPIEILVIDRAERPSDN
jgi:uncharacterized protein (TIGR03435 family)